MFKTIFFLYLFYTITWAFDLTIVHTNDIYARFEPFTSSGISCKPNKKCYGGVVKRSSYVKQVRDSESNVLVLDAGDQFQGTPWFFTYKGAAAAFFLNELNYTAMALGNHEFDNGVQGLEPFMENVSVPILCANIVKDSKFPNFMRGKVEEYKVLTFGNTKVGIIGYITSKVTELSITEGLSFEDEAKKIRKVAQYLEEEGINIIIAVGHSGLYNDKWMAAKIPEIDVFVGGHSQSFLYNGYPPTKEIIAGSYPVEVPRKNSKGLVVQAGAYGKYVGTLKVTFDEKGTVSNWSGNPVLMGSSIPDDEDLQNKVDLLSVKFKDQYAKVMGSTAMDFNAENNVCRVKECEMGNMYADAMMVYDPNWKADLAIVNAGRFRASLDEGDVTYGDIVSVFPYHYGIKFVSLLGSYLRQVFENSVDGFSLVTKHGKFLQVSKVFVKYDLTRPNGDRVVDLQVYNEKRKYFEEVSDDKEYKIILPAWLAEGGDGYEVLKEYHNSLSPTKALEADVFTAYLKNYSPIKAELEGRINGMTTFPGWSDIYKEVIWDTKKNSKISSSCRYRATLLTFIAFVFATLFTLPIISP